MSTTSAKTVTVAATQFACTDSFNENISTAERVIRKAVSMGANIILIQELFSSLYFCQDQTEKNYDLAYEVEAHPAVAKFRELAKELHVVLPCSIFERANNAHYNTIVMIDADGTILGKYRKTHIPDGPGYEEKFYFNPGDTGFQVFKTQFGCIGVGICWDQWFPECARSMALLGADLIFYPTAIGSEPKNDELNSKDHWQRVMQGHAAANMVPVIASNRIGLEKAKTIDSEITFYGSSFITDCTGGMVKVCDDHSEDVITATFNLDENRRRREGWGLFRDRRPDMYKILLTSDGQTIKV